MTFSFFHSLHKIPYPYLFILTHFHLYTITNQQPQYLTHNTRNIIMCIKNYTHAALVEMITGQIACNIIQRKRHIAVFSIHHHSSNSSPIGKEIIHQETKNGYLEPFLENCISS